MHGVGRGIESRVILYFSGPLWHAEIVKGVLAEQGGVPPGTPLLLSDGFEDIGTGVVRIKDQEFDGSGIFIIVHAQQSIGQNATA